MFYEDDSEVEDGGGIVGYHWMEGDSLAPPCNADFGVISDILDLAEPYILNPNTGPAKNSLLVDLGCGDVSDTLIKQRVE